MLRSLNVLRRGTVARLASVAASTSPTDATSSSSQDRLSKLPGFAPSRVNKKVKMDCSKVVDTIDMEDIGDKVS